MRLHLLFVLSLAGCFKVHAGDGKLKCSPNPNRQCPSGYHCAVDGSCWHNGHNPVAQDLGLDDSGIGDLGSTVADGASGDAGAAKHRGDPCSPGDVCDTGNCVDGYCCDTGCGAACAACNLSGLLGTCSPVAAGVAPMHSSCSIQDATTCGRDGLCDGAGACEKWASGTVCAPGACASGTATGESKCNGSGTCVAGGAITCDPYVCQPDGGACYQSCTDVSQCLNPNPCNTSVTPGSCGPKSLGGSCMNGSDCKSGNCVDNTCCDTAPASCTGCNACNLAGHEGHCTNVDVGTDPHNACGSVLCADKCDGHGACRAAASTTVCSAGSCTNNPWSLYAYGGTTTSITYCTGTEVGTCTGTHLTSCPGNLACSGGACLTACRYDADCIYLGTNQYYYCNAGTCTVQNPSAPCTRDTECGINAYCVSNACRLCRTSADCPYQICNSSHACVACQSNPECVSAGWGDVCESGACVCHAAGQCSTPSSPTCPGSDTSCTCGSFGYCNPTTGLACSGNTCAFPAGRPCISPASCLSGSCVNGVCS